MNDGAERRRNVRIGLLLGAGIVALFAAALTYGITQSHARKAERERTGVTAPTAQPPSSAPGKNAPPIDRQR